ncbi:GNAT family N-acetyltransferase [Priestia koreensis]|uniref:GNAT family N-acetyltransferase n=1 Tax=Priestia koreensis TaxID=284581 RepID=UPI0028F6CBEF|nr:GNAT family N-acetyltransferase [Priestia koreensis]
MLEFQYDEDFRVFKEKVIPVLETKEAEHNLILGITERLNEHTPPLFMAIVLKDKEVGAIFLQTHPNQVILAKIVDFSKEEIDHIAQELYMIYPTIPGIIGDRNMSLALIEQWAKWRNATLSVHMNQRIYQLKEVKVPVNSQGLKHIEKEDLNTAYQFLYDFSQEVNEPMTMEAVHEKITMWFDANSLYGLYKDGELISMAATTRPTRSNISVNAVYTPPSHRKKGYASQCVAALTQRMLDQGYASTSLYTDLDNPTSNKIYMEIGYEPVADSIHILLN